MSRAAAALGSGALVALSLPPWGFWPLSLIGATIYMGLMFHSRHGLERGSLGTAFGLGWLAIGCGWMWQLTIPGYVAAIAVFAGAHGCAALCVPHRRTAVVALPAAHALIEAVRFSFPFGGVPLASLGIAQVAGPLAPAARVVGTIGLGWMVFQIAALAAAVLTARPWRGRTLLHPRLVVLGLVPLAILVLGVWAPRGAATGDSLRVAAVQGGGRQGTTALEVPPLLVAQRHLEATAMISALSGDDPNRLDLVLWPENVLRIRDLPFREHPLFAAVWAQSRRLGVPFAVGITEDAHLTDRGTAREFTNAQVIFGPDGVITDRYDKVRRVPFGEYIPLRGLFERLGAPVQQVPTDAVAGTGPAVLRHGDLPPLAVVISWEAFFGGRAREGVRAGGQMVLNPTNGASYTGTIVQTQQVASNRLRALETDRWVVQAAPTGFSAVIDAEGRVIERSAVSEQRVIIAEVPLRTGHTLYTRIGDGPLIWALVLLLAGSTWREFGRRRSAATRLPTTQASR